MARQSFYISTIQDKFSNGLDENRSVDVVVLLHQPVDKSTYIEIKECFSDRFYHTVVYFDWCFAVYNCPVLDGKLVVERLLKFFIGNPGFYISSSLAAICFILERER